MPEGDTALTHRAHPGNVVVSERRLSYKSRTTQPALKAEYEELTRERTPVSAVS